MSIKRVFARGGFTDCEHESLAIHRPLVASTDVSSPRPLVPSVPPRARQFPGQGPGGMWCGGAGIIPGCHPRPIPPGSGGGGIGW